MRALAQAVRLALTVRGCRTASGVPLERYAAATSSDGRPTNG